MKNKLFKTLTPLVLVVLLITTLTSVFVLTAGAETGTEEQTYEKVTEAPADWSGTYLIVYEEGGLAFDGARGEDSNKLDAVSNTVSVNIIDSKIKGKHSANTFTIAAVDGGYSIKSASGYYIGQTSNANGLKSSTSTTYKNSISLNADGNVDIVSGGAYLRYNATSGQYRFRYYKSSSYASQKAITLYKLVENTNPDCQHANTNEVAEVPATCTEKGYTAGVYCNDCKKYISGHVEIPATGHTWGTDECTVCHTPILTIPEVNASADKTEVTVCGTVKFINTPWNDSYGNISVTIADAEGNELYLFRLATKVEVGDIIRVIGKKNTYKGNVQIDAGATAEITGCEAVLESVGVSFDTGVTIRVTYHIPEKMLTANAGAKVVFACEGETKVFDAVSGSNTYYVNLATTLMNKTVTAKIVDAEGGVLSAEEDVSLSTYRAKLAATDAAALGISEDKKAKALALIDAALKASAAANNELGEETVVVGDFTASEITRDEKVTRVYGTLGANASLIVYINSVSAESAVTVTVGDAVTDKFVFENGVLIIGGICHTKLNDTIVVSVDGTDVLTLTFNSYLKAIYDNDSVDAMNKNLAAATYLYGVAAEAYISAE